MNVPMQRKLEASKCIFLAVAKRGSAEEEERKEGWEQRSGVWGEIKRKLREGKVIAREL